MHEIVPVNIFKSFKNNNGGEEEENDENQKDAIDVINTASCYRNIDEQFLSMDKNCHTNQFQKDEEKPLISSNKIYKPKKRAPGLSLLKTHNKHHYKKLQKEHMREFKTKESRTSTASSDATPMYKRNIISMTPIQSIVPVGYSPNPMNEMLIRPYHGMHDLRYYYDRPKAEKAKDFFMIVPEIIQRWLRLFFNILITSMIVLLIFFIYKSVRIDINNKISEQQQIMKDGSMMCRKSYSKYKCDENPVPELWSKCQELYMCMRSDETAHAQVSFISAQMLGQIMNTFIAQFEWKSIVVISMIFIVIFVGSNYALTIGANSRNSNNGNLPTSPVAYCGYPYVPQPMTPDVPMLHYSRYHPSDMTNYDDQTIRQLNNNLNNNPIRTNEPFVDLNQNL